MQKWNLRSDRQEKDHQETSVKNITKSADDNQTPAIKRKEHFEHLQKTFKKNKRKPHFQASRAQQHRNYNEMKHSCEELNNDATKFCKLFLNCKNYKDEWKKTKKTFKKL